MAVKKFVLKNIVKSIVGGVIGGTPIADIKENIQSAHRATTNDPTLGSGRLDLIRLFAMAAASFCLCYVVVKTGAGQMTVKMGDTLIGYIFKFLEFIFG